jgi:transposase-like protein
MPRQYSPDHKAAILERLHANGGDIAITHLQTGIPERTLRDWRRAIWLHSPPPPPPPTPTWRRQNDSTPDIAKPQPLPSSEDNVPVFKDDLDALAYLRRQIVNELVKIASAFQDSLQLVSPYQRVTILSQLTDRLMKLDAHLKPYTPREQIVRIVRVKRPIGYLTGEENPEQDDSNEPPTETSEEIRRWPVK